MGLLNNTPQEYYDGNDFGSYQFTSLKDIINQFMLVYVGEGKIIPNAKRMDVAFHAQRALAELSFDTLKSCKAQEITVPASLQMVLPQDYVNYTKVSWSDSAGIKHLLYPVSKTSNPTKIEQKENGEYSFATNPLLINQDFSSPLADPWFTSEIGMYYLFPVPIAYYGSTFAQDAISLNSGRLRFTQSALKNFSNNKSRVYGVWQQIDVSSQNSVTLSATGKVLAASGDVDVSSLSIGIVGENPTGWDTNAYSTQVVSAGGTATPLDVDTPWLQTLNGNDAVINWTNGEIDVNKLLVNSDAIDVSSYSTVWVLIISKSTFKNGSTTDTTLNEIDNIVLENTESLTILQTSSNSTTWSNYKSQTPSENNNDDYEDDTYWPMNGQRYGLDPQHAQANGSFYIDCKSGKIHFSSNISGKTVILDYISDSLGTDGEMQVHKFAEEAMYKWISHAILSGRANIPEYQVNRFKKERFAAIRTAKLRLSNLKLEELTQILRGKSKQIKH